MPTTILIDDSHLIVSLRSCECGRQYLSVFTEVVDWVGGDDAQHHQVIEIDPALAAVLVARQGLDQGDVDELGLTGRIVAWSHPSGGIETLQAYEGLFQVPFHD